MVLGIFVYFWVPSRLDGAWFLNREEREWAVERMRLDSGGMDYQQAGITKDAFIRTCKDWKWSKLGLFVTWAMTDWRAVMVWPGQFVAGLTTSAFTTFIPIIVQQLGYVSPPLESIKLTLRRVSRPIYTLYRFTSQPREVSSSSSSRRITSAREAFTTSSRSSSPSLD